MTKHWIEHGILILDSSWFVQDYAILISVLTCKWEIFRAHEFSFMIFSFVKSSMTRSETSAFSRQDILSGDDKTRIDEREERERERKKATKNCKNVTDFPLISHDIFSLSRSVTYWSDERPFMEKTLPPFLCPWHGPKQRKTENIFRISGQILWQLILDRLRLKS